MARWAELCARAAGGDKLGAARAFLAEADAPTVHRLLDAALWRPADVADFEARGLAVLLETPAGRLWLASPSAARTLLPAAPRVAPSAVVALASGLVEAVR